jgi:hypothetical protein
MLGRNNVEDISVVEMFLQEVGLDEGQKDEIVAIIKGMGELFTYSVIHVYASSFLFEDIPHWGHTLV